MGDSGLAILGLVGLYLLMKGKKNGRNGITSNGGYGTTTPFTQTFRIYYEEGSPQTQEQAQTITREFIRTRKIISVLDKTPLVPTQRQIETKHRRVAEIDKRVPTWVKARWGKTGAFQIPADMPQGER